MTRRRGLLALGAVVAAAGVGVAIALLVWDRSDSGPVASELNPEGGQELRQREGWFYEQRTTVGQRVPADAFVKARRSAARARGAAGAEALRWTELGPAAIGVGGPEPNEDLDWGWGGPSPYSGRVTSIANHPTRAATAYIGTSGGGVWRTTDDGETWTPLFDRQPSLSIGAVAVDPDAPDTVYAGTGEANIGVPSYFGAGVFKSTNGGSEWTKIGGSAFDECHISALGVKGRVVLVAAHGYGANRWEYWPDRCKDRQGLWLSEDSGDNFRLLSVDGGVPADLASSPRDPSVWYAAFWGARIYKSTDSGRTWRKLELRTTTPTGTVDVVSDGLRIDIDVARSATGQTDVVYAAVATRGEQMRGVFRSLDGGETWEKLNPTVVAAEWRVEFADACDRQCNYNLVIAADPSDPSRAFFGGTFINRYDGSSASLILWGDVHVDFHALGFDASGRLWIGSDGGIYRSDDGGRTAANLNAGIGTALIYPGISGSASGPLYVGMQDNGSARYSGSPSWALVNWGDGFFTAVNPANPLPAYTTVYYLTITKLNANGRCVGYEHVGLPDAGDEQKAPFNAPLVMHPREPSVMYAGTSRVWKTTNAGAPECRATTWSPASQPFGAWVTGIAPAPSDARVVYAATAPTNTRAAGLYVTKPGDPATTWVDTQPNGLPVGRHFTDIAVHPTDPATAWVTVSGFADGAHIYGTTNYGQTWTDLDNGLPNAPANAVVVDTRGARPVLYVGTDVGVYASDNGGSSWTNIGGNLPNAAVMDLLLDTSSSPPRLVAATFGRGAWSAPLP
jgi:photosystem II stability/assembly factor-like uncharacterized protein